MPQLRLNKTYSTLFFVFLILGVYYPAIFAGAITIDDQKIMYHIESVEHLDFLGLFSFGQNVFYYRPITMLTFHLDHFLWDLRPSFMHLENVLLHLLNSLLVTVLASKMFCDKRDKNAYAVPLLCGLLFGLHPINTESVNWISGRTDVLAATFLIACCIYLIQALRENRLRYSFFASVCFVLAVISKEVTLFFLPAAFFIMLRWPVDRISPKRYWHAILFGSPFLVGLLSYAVIRVSRYTLGGGAVTRILEHYPYDSFNTIRVCLKAFGFYVKKLIVPAPLNFVILEISDMYVWLGLAALLLFLWGAWRWRSNYGIMLLVAWYMTLPAILIALFSVAWTPLAERYLYFSSIFFVLAVVGFALKYFPPETWQKGKLAYAPMLVIVFLLGASSAVTAHRTIVWQDMETLYKDSLDKSPNSLAMHNELAIIYREQGRFAEADEMIAFGQDKASGAEIETYLLYINEALNLEKEDRLYEAYDVLKNYCPIEAECNVEVLKAQAMIAERIRGELATTEMKSKLAEALIETYGLIYRLNGNSFLLYRSGQLLLETGQRKEAASMFEKAAQSAPEGAYYKKPAETLAARLAEQK